MNVLVTDGNERAALAVTRALGRQGLQVAVGAENEASLAAASKYCWQSFSYPSPYADEGAFIARLLDVVKALKIGMVFPISEIAMALAVRHRREFEADAILPIPSADAFETLSNKYRLMQLGTELSVPIPETAFVSDGRWNRVGKLPDFPVVIKPGQSVVRIAGHRCKTGIHYAASEAELERLYSSIDYLRLPSMIQRRIEGEGQGVFALMDNGRPVSLFAHRRLREKPPSGGVSVLRESVALPQPMTDYALRLLQHVGWHGVAMVEFKVDRQSGMPLLMEVNGRFWGSLQLSLDAGINFPYLMYRIASGEDPHPVVNGYRTGVKSRWLLGDLDHLLLRLLKSEEELALPPNSPTKLKTLLEFCRFYEPGTRNEVLRFDDPKPFVRELSRYVRDLVRPRRANIG